MKFKSFHVVKTVLEDANERFSPIYVPDAERVNILEQYCSAIDSMIERHDGSEFECEVDEILMTVIFRVVLEEVKVESWDAPFNQLAERSLSFRVDHAGEDSIRITFVFPSLWRKA